MFDLTQGGVSLLLIDMQNEFLSEKGYFAQKQGWPVSAFRQKIDHCVMLRKAARESGCKVIYTATGYAPDGSDAYVSRHRILPTIFLEPDGRPRKPDAAVLKGSWGAQIIDELAPGQDEYVVHKQRFNAFYQTELELMLRCWHIDTLVVCGIITEVCVESTIREAFVRDFDVLEVSDAVGSWSQARHEASLRAVDFSYGRVTDTAAVLEMLLRRKQILGL